MIGQSTKIVTGKQLWAQARVSKTADVTFLPQHFIHFSRFDQVRDTTHD